MSRRRCSSGVPNGEGAALTSSTINPKRSEPTAVALSSSLRIPEGSALRLRFLNGVTGFAAGSKWIRPPSLPCYEPVADGRAMMTTGMSACSMMYDTRWPKKGRFVSGRVAVPITSMS